MSRQSTASQFLCMCWLFCGFVSRTVARGSVSIAKKGDAVRLRRTLTVLRPELLAYARSLTLEISEAEDLGSGPINFEDSQAV